MASSIWLSRAHILSDWCNDTGLQRTYLRPAPRPQRCASRQLRSPLLSANSEEVLRRDDAAKRFREHLPANRTQALAWRGHASILHQRVRSCAVVGSSSKLLDAEDGKAIDAADVIFRMNHAPTPARLQRHVGSRTDVHVDPMHVASRFALRGDAIQIYSCTTNHDFPGCLHFSPRRWTNGTNVVSLEAIEGRWDRTAPALDWMGRMIVESMHHRGVAKASGVFNRPTTGLMTVLLALHVCDRTTLYGFGMSAVQPCAKYFREVAHGHALGHEAAITNASLCGSAKTRETYRTDYLHNYDAEEAWIRQATRNYTRNTLTCEILPDLGLAADKATYKALDASMSVFGLGVDV